jgi:transcriptional regulator with XRE-family HTH domain
MRSQGLISNIQFMLAQKEMRDGKRYKQIEIAREAGLTQSVLSRMMSSSDISSFTLVSAKLLAEWLGCAIEDLYKKPTENQAL